MHKTHGWHAPDALLILYGTGYVPAVLSSHFQKEKHMTTPESPLAAKIVSWDETWLTWRKETPKSLRRSSIKTQKITRIFNEMTKEARAGTLALHHARPDKPVFSHPESEDWFYGLSGCHLKASDVLAAFDRASPDAEPEIRKSLVLALENTPDRTAAPAQPLHRRKNGRWYLTP